MHTVVCIRQVLDPEIPPSEFRLDPAGREAAPGSAPLVISIFDENALEVALQLREKTGEGKITALCLGAPSGIDALRKALSMRSDEAILLRAEDFPGADARGIARILAAAIRKLEPVDLVLCGREAADWHGGQVGGFLAAELERAYVSFVAGIERVNGKLRLRRQADDGWEIIEAAPPAVASVTNDDTNLPRIPKVKDNMLAFRKQIPVWTAADLGIDAAGLKSARGALEARTLDIPVSDRSCEMVAGANVNEKAAQLVEKLAAVRAL